MLAHIRHPIRFGEATHVSFRFHSHRCTSIIIDSPTLPKTCQHTQQQQQQQQLRASYAAPQPHPCRRHQQQQHDPSQTTDHNDNQRCQSQTSCTSSSATCYQAPQTHHARKSEQRAAHRLPNQIWKTVNRTPPTGSSRNTLPLTRNHSKKKCTVGSACTSCCK